MLVAVCSVKGSPGVTTFSLALAARWPVPEAECVVVEADPAGGDVAIRFDLPTTPGLVSLAAAARRDQDPRLLWRHAQALPGGLPVVVCPVSVAQTRAALTALGPGIVRRAGDLDGALVVADCGRLDAESPAEPVLGAADHTLLMVRAHTPDLAHVASRLATITQTARRAHLVLVGSGHTAGDVTRELGTPVLGVVPDDPRGAAALGGHLGKRTRRPSRSALGRAAARVARKLTAAAPPPPDTAAVTVDGVPVLNDGVGLTRRDGGRWHGRRP